MATPRSLTRIFFDTTAEHQLTYYQYSVTLPVFGLDLIERWILNTIVALFILVLLLTGVCVLGILYMLVVSFPNGAMQ